MMTIPQQPLAPRAVFISHRHADHRIADALRKWIEETAIGTPVEVFQSSQPGGGPRPGHPLNEELHRQLKKANVVLCVFTVQDADWSYCMWECGLATDPVKPSTNVIILQCTSHFPAPFQDRVRVDARELSSIENFVTGFLTEPEFFPNSGGPLAPRWEPGSDRVKRKADALFHGLKDLLPEESAEWRPWPVLILELKNSEVAQLSDCRDETDRLHTVNDLLTSSCVAVDAQRTAPNLFGIAHFQTRHAFQWIKEAWERTNPTSESVWITSIARQISLAARDLMPYTDWVLMESGPRGAGQWYTPVLCWTRRNSTKGWVQFDIYFIPAKGRDPGTGAPDLGYGPKNPEGDHPLGPIPPSEAAARWEEQVSSANDDEDPKND